MPPPAATSPDGFLSRRRLHLAVVPLLLVLTAVLAVTSLLGDSITFDEPSKFVSGLSYLRTGDFRLAADHPPLSKYWVALPAWFMDVEWPPRDEEHWVNSNVFPFARRVLFELNDGQRLIVTARLMMVVVLLATNLSIYALGRTLLGPGAGLLALVLATLSPTLLAHGRLVGTDIPIALCFTLVLLTTARLLQRATWPRLLAAAASLAAASVTKMSWPLVVPALLVMGGLAMLRRERAAAPSQANALPGLRRAPLLLGAALFMGLSVWLAIWMCYGWRQTIIAPPALDDPHARELAERAAARISLLWQIAMHHPDEGPGTRLIATSIDWLARQELLPDAYVFGLAWTMLSTSGRPAYFLGDYSNEGWLLYFPVAFVLKTPLPVLGLLISGVVALVRRKLVVRDHLLLMGVLTLAGLYTAYVVTSGFNIGIRHLLPVYPVVFVLAGAATAWSRTRPGRILIGAGVAWLVAANAWIYPHYLSYFNELIGGPSRGQHYLADSNIDWGQDLLRLAAYARAHPDEDIKLAYFGSATPTFYLDCTALPSKHEFDPPAELTAGTYVVSLTQLLGVYDPELRDTFWTPEVRAAYATLAEIANSTPIPDEAQEVNAQRAQAREELGELRRKRLANRLAQRPPDERIGYSLFVYHLTAGDVEALTRP